MSLLLVRHGETALNRARVLQPPDTPLSERGLAQARAVAAHLADLRPAALISSDLPRAVQTAQAVARACGLPLETDARLRERDFGDWRGLPYDGLSADPLTMADAPPGGESLATFTARCALAFEALVARRAALDGPLVVISHGLVIGMMLRGRPLPPGVPFPTRLGNTSVNELDAGAPHAVRRLDALLHLQGGLADDNRSLSGG